MNRGIIVFDNKQAFLENSGDSTNGNAALKIQPAPFEVLHISNAEELIPTIENHSREKKFFAGLFIDLDVPFTTSIFTTLEILKNIDSNLSYIFMTSCPENQLMQVEKVFGFDGRYRWDFLRKPFSNEEIYQKAQRVISVWDRAQKEAKHLTLVQPNDEQMMRAERLAAIGTLARGMGHEFGNTLHSIMGKADIALQKKTPDGMEKALKAIVEASEKASVVVKNLQSLAKMDSTREKVNLAEPILECTQLIQFEMKKYKVVFNEKHEGPLPVLTLNRFEINQAFLNLMVNAIHAMEKGGDLTIRTVLDQKGISIIFADTGCGISPDKLEKIFDPLYTTKQFEGSGLGLSVTKKIIENHGGRLDVASEVGKGTTFRIWLPNK